MRNKKTGMLCILALALGSMALTPAAEETSLTIFPAENVTVSSFVTEEPAAVYVRPTGTYEWSADVLSGGEGIFDPAVSSYDLCLEGADGGREIFLGLPLGRASDIRLYTEDGFTRSEYRNEDGEEVSTVPVRAYDTPKRMRVRRTLNVRARSGADQEKVGSFAEGQEVTVLGETNNTDRQWLAVELNGVVRYCVGNNMDEVSIPEAVPAPVDAAEDEPAAEAEESSGSGLESSAGASSSWSALGGLGSPASSGGTSTETASQLQEYEKPVMMKVTRNINVRTGPGTDSSKIGELTTNAEVEAYGEILTERKWTQILYNGSLVYCVSDYLTPVGDAPVFAEAAAPENDETSAAQEEAEDSSPEDSQDAGEEPLTEETTEENTPEDESEEDILSDKGEPEEEALSGEEEPEEETLSGEETSEEETLSEEEPEEETVSRDEESEEESAYEENPSEEEEALAGPAIPEEEDLENPGEESGEEWMEEELFDDAGESPEEGEEQTSEAGTALEVTTEAAAEPTTESVPEVTTEAAAEVTTEDPAAAGPDWHTIERVETVQSIRRPGHGYKFVLYSDGMVEVQVF